MNSIVISFRFEQYKDLPFKSVPISSSPLSIRDDNRQRDNTQLVSYYLGMEHEKAQHHF